MSPRSLHLRILSTTLPMLLASLAAQAQGTVTIKTAEDRFTVEVDGKLFTELVFADTPKPILYPIIGPFDIPMTRNFPMKPDVAGEAKDHPHHRSLWYTHGDVNGVDFWSENPTAGKIVQDKTVEVVSGQDVGRIKTENKWVAPDGSLVCTDIRTLSFQALPSGKVIDFEITLKALDKDLVLGDTKEGTMGIRSHPNLQLVNGSGVTTANGQAVNSEGLTGKDIWGKKARWVDYWGTVDDKVVGIAIFDHPKNPRHPTWWHARDYGLIAANPFGVHDFEKKPAGEGNMTVKAGESVTFTYRFLFHEGDAQSLDTAKRYEEWIQETP